MPQGVFKFICVIRRTLWRAVIIVIDILCLIFATLGLWVKLDLQYVQSDLSKSFATCVFSIGAGVFEQSKTIFQVRKHCGIVQEN